MGEIIPTLEATIHHNSAAQYAQVHMGEIIPVLEATIHHNSAVKHAQVRAPKKYLSCIPLFFFHASSLIFKLSSVASLSFSCNLPA